MTASVFLFDFTSVSSCLVVRVDLKGKLINNEKWMSMGRPASFTPWSFFGRLTHSFAVLISCLLPPFKNT